MVSLKQNIRILGGSLKRMFLHSFHLNPNIALKLYINDWMKFLSTNSTSQYKAYQKQHDIIEKFLLQKGYYDILNNAFRNAKQNDYTNNELMPIWVCWWQGEDQMPPIVKRCYERILQFANLHPVHLITLDNFSDYVEIPSEIIHQFYKGKIKYAHLADLLRLKLLAKYGGLWLDSTIYLIHPIDESIFNKPFYSIKNEPMNNLSVSEFRWCTFFMESMPGNPFVVAIEKALETYMLEETIFIHYLLIDYLMDIIYRKNAYVQNLIDKIPLTNPAMHWSGKLNDAFCASYFDDIAKNTFLLKTTYKGILSRQTSTGEMTYYDYLLKY